MPVLQRRRVLLLLLLLRVCRTAAAAAAAAVQWHGQHLQDRIVVEDIFKDHLVPAAGPAGGRRRRRHFVELGAADGLRISNTLSLERHFGWHGLCIEPSLAYARLARSGRTCVKRGDAVSGRAGDVVDFVDQAQAGGTHEPADRDPASRLPAMTAPPSAEGLYSGIAAAMSTYRVAGAVTRKVTRTRWPRSSTRAAFRCTSTFSASTRKAPSWTSWRPFRSAAAALAPCSSSTTTRPFAAAI